MLCRSVVVGVRTLWCRVGVWVVLVLFGLKTEEGIDERWWRGML
jgi:hypothetical protein